MCYCSGSSKLASKLKFALAVFSLPSLILMTLNQTLTLNLEMGSKSTPQEIHDANSNQEGTKSNPPPPPPPQ